MTRRACLAIGVATITPLQNQQSKFADLDGAVVSARAIGEWARRSNFGEQNVRVVDDGRVNGKPNPVTRERVQKAVDELFPDGAEQVEQLILVFCGHGLTDATQNSMSWLFSDSLALRYRVFVNNFTEELLRHNVQRITLIADACREVPKTEELLRLEVSRGITVQGDRVESPRFDSFAACQDAQLGFMVSEQNSANPGKCIFSGVITDVLWGNEPNAIDNNGKITTSTFGKYIRARATERAQTYHLKLFPQCFIDPEEAVLYDKAMPPLNLPALQPWADAGAATIMGASVPESVVPADARRNLELVKSDSVFRKQILGSTFGARRISNESLTIPDASKEILQDLVTVRGAPPGGGNQRKAEALVKRLESDAVADMRSRAADDVRRSLSQILPTLDGPNLIVLGGRATLWSSEPPVQSATTAVSSEFRVKTDQKGAPVLIELANGSFTPVVPYAGLYAVVAQSTAGDVLQAYGQHDSSESYRSALAAITDFAAGRIGLDGIGELAARLRQEKHADPGLGAICAYLYRSVADFDSIRRMAYFYFAASQPVPFDIALLGGMNVSTEADGALALHVPEVKARAQGGPSMPDYVTMATPAVKASIGGRCPWLGLGWDYVGLPRPEWEVLVEGLAIHAPEIRRDGFTALPSATGQALAKSWKLEAR